MNKYVDLLRSELIEKTESDQSLIRELVEALKEEHEHFINNVYRDPKTHKRDHCRFCAIIASAEKTLC